MADKGLGRCRTLRFVGILSFLLANSGVGIAQSPFERISVELVTAEPGAVYWERYGHNSIVLRDSTSGTAISYNYGIFDFNQENFFWRFIRGHMLYSMAAFDADQDIGRYLDQGRGVTIQKLRLSTEEKERLYQYLNDNLKPENRDYRYDYFLSNCSTKVRDALNHATLGRIERQFQTMGSPDSFRSLASELAGPVFWLDAGSRLGLGRMTDGSVNRWQSFFLPGELARSLTLAPSFTVGQPLVEDSQRLGPSAVSAPSQGSGRPGAAWLLAGILVAAALWLLRKTPASASLFWLITGLTGLAVSGLSLTDHWAAHYNENVLLLSPLACLLVYPQWRSSTMGKWISISILVSLGMAIGLKFLPDYQQNMEFIAFLVPPQLVALYLRLWQTQS